MPVDDPIDLNKPLTDAQINKLEKDADRMEKAAEKAQEAAQKANQAMANNPMGGAVPMKKGKPEGYDPSTAISAITKPEEGGASYGQDDPLSGFGGRGAEAGQRKGYRRVGESRRLSPIAKQAPEYVLQELANKQQILQAEQKKQADEIKKQRAEAMATKMQQQRMMSGVSGGFSKINQGFAFAKGPGGFVKGKALGMLGGFTVWGAIAAMVIQQVQGLWDQVNQQIKDMYKAGGIFDVRKETLDAVKQVSALQSIIDMEQGRLFFTSDTGESLRQGISQAANTNTRVNGFKQYTQEYER